MSARKDLPKGSALRRKKDAGTTVFRWPAPANNFERLGPDRVFALTVAVCAPAALIAFFIEPLWSAAFLFAILAGAGVRGAPSRPTGFEEIEVSESGIVVRSGGGAGLFGRVKDPAVDWGAAGREMARLGREELQDVRIQGAGRQERLVLAGTRAAVVLGSCLDAQDRTWLQAFLRDWRGV